MSRSRIARAAPLGSFAGGCPGDEARIYSTGSSIKSAQGNGADKWAPFLSTDRSGRRVRKRDLSFGRLLFSSTSNLLVGVGQSSCPYVPFSSALSYQEGFRLNHPVAFGVGTSLWCKRLPCCGVIWTSRQRFSGVPTWLLSPPSTPLAWRNRD